jgi:glucose-6-phosphate 1-epimerase
MAKLDERFGIPGVVQVVAGEGGLAKISITGGLSSADIYLHGAQVTSWRPAGQQEVLFLSRESRWEDGRAIRGGIPICFPWFRGKADHPQAPAHGVVRTKAWTLVSTAQSPEGVVVCLATESDETSRKWWPHEFRLVHRISIGAELGLELTATNRGAGPMRFEEALHTYFRVGDVRKVNVAGLDGTTFLDNTDGNREKRQRGNVAIEKATDNAYLDTRGPLELIDPALRRSLRTVKGNSLTTVVWNPWEDGAKALADLGDEEWQQMACVEASNILGAAVNLAPGEEHAMNATLRVGAEETPITS